MGKRGPQPKPKPGNKSANTTIKPQGSTTKRTPTSAFDGAAGKDVYEPEKVTAKRLAKGVTQYLVKWKGYEIKDSTWEPIEHLAGCEDMIAEFVERESTRIAQLEAVAAAKRIEKEAQLASVAAKAAEDAAAARIAASAAGAREEHLAPCLDANEEVKVSKNNSGGGAKRSSWAWRVFDEVGCAHGKACCKLTKSDGEFCGEAITTLGGPTAMKNHVMFRHPDDYIKLAPPSEKLNVKLDPQSKMMALHGRHRQSLQQPLWPQQRLRPRHELLARTIPQLTQSVTWALLFAMGSNGAVR
ncbi:hypothetical protein AB1Y20_004200 [Prymnesium parvum]|uniref:Chromo domain-containing protein n=1 Tax=Prymnesium parvum TaxID=97485 RepID=A0AB34J9A6_PRYPA